MFLRFNKIRKDARGVTLVELMLALAIILLVIAPLVKALYQGMKGSVRFGETNKAIQLAQELTEEIKQKKWDETTPIGGGAATTPSAIGIDGGETAGNKTTYDDIDDYNGLVEHPPKDINNVEIPNSSHFTRTVTVAYVNILMANPPAVNLVQISGATTNYKQITVTITWEGYTTPVVLKTVVANLKTY